MKKTAYMGLLLAFALILGYVESLIPFYFGIPGVKLGLANFAIVMTLYLYGSKESLLINVLRITLSAFLFGNMYTLLYSMAGGLLSNCAMIVFKKTKLFSIIGISMMGGVVHNAGQLLIAYFVVRTTGLLFYAPILLLSGLITGFIIGMIQIPVHKRIQSIFT